MGCPKATNQLDLTADRETTMNEANLQATTSKGTKHANPCKVWNSPRTTGEERRGAERAKRGSRETIAEVTS